MSSACPPQQVRVQSVHKLRGIGVLALLLSLGSLAMAINALRGESPQTFGFVFPGLGLLTAYIAIQTSGLSRGAHALARIATVIAVIAMLIVGVNYARPVWETMAPAQPQISAPVAPAVPEAPIAPAPAEAAPELHLGQIAGTIAFLMDHQCPSFMQPTSSGAIVTMKGSFQLPDDVRFGFTRQAEGCAIRVSRPDGSYAAWDSLLDQVSAG